MSIFGTQAGYLKITEMIDFIQGNKFKGLTNIHYAPQRGPMPENYYWESVNNIAVNDYRYIKNTMDINTLKDGDVIYTHNFYVDQLFNLIKTVDVKLVVVTHNCDTTMAVTPPDNVIRWFSQNVSIVHDRVESIPIGLENDRWFPEVHKRDKMMAKLHEERSYKELVYMNHSTRTNSAKRLEPYRVLEGKPWVMSERGANGSGFDEYLDNIYNHRFVVCPEGNGMDTHRTWECLYMGSIPIEKRNINNSFYTDLPICFVDDWEQVTIDFLVEEDERIKESVWNMDKLKFEYWKNKITNYGV